MHMEVPQSHQRLPAVRHSRLACHPKLRRSGVGAWGLKTREDSSQDDENSSCSVHRCSSRRADKRFTYKKLQSVMALFLAQVP